MKNNHRCRRPIPLGGSMKNNHRSQRPRYYVYVGSWNSTCTRGAIVKGIQDLCEANQIPIKFVSRWDCCSFIWKPSAKGIDPLIWKMIDNIPHGLLARMPGHHFLTDLSSSMFRKTDTEMSPSAFLPLAYNMGEFQKIAHSFEGDKLWNVRWASEKIGYSSEPSPVYDVFTSRGSSFPVSPISPFSPTSTSPVSFPRGGSVGNVGSGRSSVSPTYDVQTITSSDVGSGFVDARPDDLVQEVLDVKSRLYAHVLILPDPHQGFVFDRMFRRNGKPATVDYSTRNKLAEIIYDVFRGTERYLNPDRHKCCFELFECEITETLDDRLLLTAINTNPCVYHDDFETTSHYNGLGLAWMSRSGEDPKKISALFEFNYVGTL